MNALDDETGISVRNKMDDDNDEVINDDDDDEENEDDDEHINDDDSEYEIEEDEDNIDDNDTEEEDDNSHDCARSRHTVAMTKKTSPVQVRQQQPQSAIRCSPRIRTIADRRKHITNTSNSTTTIQSRPKRTCTKRKYIEYNSTSDTGSASESDCNELDDKVDESVIVHDKDNDGNSNSNNHHSKASTPCTADMEDDDDLMSLQDESRHGAILEVEVINRDGTYRKHYVSPITSTKKRTMHDYFSCTTKSKVVKEAEKVPRNRRSTAVTSSHKGQSKRHKRTTNSIPVETKSSKKTKQNTVIVTKTVKSTSTTSKRKISQTDNKKTQVVLPNISKSNVSKPKGGCRPSTSSSGTKINPPKGIIYDKKPYSNGADLEKICDIQHMFDDMIQQKILSNDTYSTLLCSLLRKTTTTATQSQQRPIKVATMCSGTESPILALDMIQNAIYDAVMTCTMTHRNNPTPPTTKNGSISKQFQQFVESTFPQLLLSPSSSTLQQQNLLPIQHIFSCEIEPYKQAYIERNFAPPLLFRDIRELGNDHAYTAYGSYVPVPNKPGCVDILIAGTSCVDYSNLNNQKKNMEDKGESGATFYGMIRWIKKTKPPIVIIENVYGAPWNEKVKIFEDLGYSATFLRLDTKDYYIPHTRQRGYLFAVLRTKGKSKKSKEDPQTTEWANMVTALKRPASASVDDFMLPNDDPRVLRGRARLTVEASEGDNSSSRAGRVDWTKCETRHLASRSLEELGDKRPLTNWSDSGSTSLPSFCWNEWCNVQVHRIHDLMDVNTLRLAKVGMDCTYKTMVWNLSQNVDRDTMGKLGLCQCLTPTGVPYATNRGGPLVGEELLMLQGIPVDDLLLTKETEENLKDLAGNAMSTTVVGACTLCALLLGQDALWLLDDDSKDQTLSQNISSLVPRPLQSPSTVRISDQYGIYDEHTLGSSTHREQYLWSVFLTDAAMSAKMCVSEGEDEALPMKSIAKCADCGHTASVTNAFPIRKYEEHEFQQDSTSRTRMDPVSFRRRLVNRLPMRVVLTGIDLDEIDRPNSIESEVWMKWKEAVQSSLKKPDGELVEFRFTIVVRATEWKAVYESRSKARLEIRISKRGVTWLIFANPPAGEGHLKQILAQPFARMHVVPSTDDSFSMLKGKWEICFPVTSRLQINITGVGRQLPSWRNRLGLKGKFENEYQYETLRINVESSNTSELRELKEKIDGDYTLLPKCGGACGSLRRKVNHASKNEELYFFLESKRSTLACDDTYVISPKFERTDYNEYREVYLEIEKGYCPLQYSATNSLCQNMIPCSSFGCWTLFEKAVVKEASSLSTIVRIPVRSLEVPMRSDGWKVCPELLSATIQVDASDDLVTDCLKLGGFVEVNLQKSSKIMKDIAFSTSRWSLPPIVSTGDWLSLRPHGIGDKNANIRSDTCAPTKPNIKWALVSKGKRASYVPLEDGKEAAVYERSLKARPKPWLLRIIVNPLENAATSASMTIQIGCNAVSIVQRALGLLPESSIARKSMKENRCIETDNYKYEWRIALHKDVGISFPKLSLSSNKLDVEASQPPHFDKYQLRKEQLRSLTWMLKQESTTEPYYEEEVSEAVLPSLNWRVEGRVQRPVLVRGGIIADEVGYGKTAITLGLIDAAESVNGNPPDPPSDYRNGYIYTKATLVVVPKHLMGQWPDEITKFLGKSKKVCVVQDLNSLNKLTIGDFQSADIVVVSFAVLNNDNYFTRLARISGINKESIPTGGGSSRHFATVYNECVAALPSQVEKIISNCSGMYDSVSEIAKSYENENPNNSILLDGKKNIYKQGKKAHELTKQPTKPSSSDIDPWGLSSLGVKKNYRKMASPPLEAFFWQRLVVDEFTYLAKKDRERVLEVISNIHCSFRWCLSGTPKHANFNDVSILASLLGVHLGVDEVLPGVKLTNKYLSDNESSGVESLSHYLESRSLQWHGRRHKLAQSFLNRFVRQNVAEIDEIPFEEHSCMISLPAVERAIYMELETHLKSLEMNSKTAQKSKRKSTGDRESRMQRILEESDSAEEALLKCCSQFNMSASFTALETIDDIIKLRNSEKERLENEMIQALAAAFRQQQRILNNQPDWGTITFTGKGEVRDALQVFLAEVAAKKSVPHGADDEINDRICALVSNSEEAFESNPNDMDVYFDPSDNIENDSDETTLFAMKHALRNHMHFVRSLTKELCGRIRSLRYIQHIRQFQLNTEASTTKKFECIVCKNDMCSTSNNSVGVLSCCGHAGCIQCLNTYAGEGLCIVPNCCARVSTAHIASADRLGVDGNSDINNRSGKFGRKLTAIIQKVKDILQNGKGDRIVIFCQFDDLKSLVAEALRSSSIKSIQVKGTVIQQMNALAIFQKDTLDKTDPRVLLLKMDDEQSAGLNLTNINHAIFVHPLLAVSQEEYDAYETQAIGRIRRYGQKKVVYCYRFLAMDTIDTETYEQRGKKKVKE